MAEVAQLGGWASVLSEPWSVPQSLEDGPQPRAQPALTSLSECLHLGNCFFKLPKLKSEYSRKQIPGAENRSFEALMERKTLQQHLCPRGSATGFPGAQGFKFSTCHQHSRLTLVRPLLGPLSLPPPLCHCSAHTNQGRLLPGRAWQPFPNLPAVPRD